MARPINAALFVDVFTATGTPGEYTFDSALFNNQADQTGNGAYDVVPGFALYVPSTDANTAFAIPGVVHRYVLTSVTQIDPATISGTILWDEPGVEGTEIPTNGAGCLLCETSPSIGIGYLPSDAVYSNLNAGSTVQSMLLDSWDRIDPNTGGGGGGTTSYAETIGDAGLVTFVVTHGLGTLDVMVEIFELATGSTVYCGIERTSVDTISVSFTEIPELASHRVLVRKI